MTKATSREGVGYDDASPIDNKEEEEVSKAVEDAIKKEKKEEQRKRRQQRKENEKLEQNINFAAGFDHGFGAVAEYVPGSSSEDDEPPVKKTNENQKGMSTQSKTPATEFDINFGSDPKPQEQKPFNFDDFLSQEAPKTFAIDLPDV